MRELASPTLSMNEGPVTLILSQAAWELGSYNSKSCLRVAHQVFEDSAFVARFIEVLEQRLHAIESNWNEHNTLYALVILGLRLHSLYNRRPMADCAVSFLRKIRQVAMRWCQTLLASLDSHTGKDSDAHGRLILKVGGICQLTYALELWRLPSVLTSREDLMMWTWSSMITYDNSPKSSDQLPTETKAILIRTMKLLHHVEERARQLIEVDASGLNDALKLIAPNVQVSSPWRFCDGRLSRWATNQTQATSHARQLEVRYDLLSGEFLVDNSPPGRLPAEYTGHPLFQRVFGLVSNRFYI